MYMPGHFAYRTKEVATLILVEAMSDKPARFVRLAGGRCFLAKTLDCTPVRRVGWSYVGNVAVGSPGQRPCGHLPHP